MLLAESERDLQGVVNEFYSVCNRRKFKVYAGKSKVMVFERREEEVVDFNSFATGPCQEGTGPVYTLTYIHTHTQT